MNRNNERNSYIKTAIVPDISLTLLVFLIILIIRYDHCSWASPSGLVLLGGDSSPRTTEKIQEDGTSSYSFTLKYDTE